MVKLRYFLILAFFVLAITPVLLFRAWPQANVLDAKIATAQERHMRLAKSIAAALDRYQNDVGNTVLLLASHATALHKEPEAVQLMQHMNIRSICVVARDIESASEVLSTSDRPCPEVEPQIWRGIYSEVLPGRFSFGDVEKGTDGENVMRVFAQTDGRRLVVAEIDTTYFREIGAGSAENAGAGAIIVDHSGNTLAHSRRDWVAERKSLTLMPPVIKAMSGATGVQVFQDFETQRDIVVSYTSVPNSGWGVMIPQPMSELMALARSEQQSSIYVLLTGVAGALVLALVFSRLLARPLEEVTRAAVRVSDGDFAEPDIPGHLRFLPSEFGEFLAEFQSMVLRLRETTTKIHTLAFVDSVTGLSNREYFRRSVDAFVDYAGPDEQAGMLFLDLDGFKTINDTKGHEVGDEVLVTIADRIRDTLALPPFVETCPSEASILPRRQSLQLARLGGDEFAVFAPGFNGQRAVHLAESLLCAIEEPIDLIGGGVSLSASIGVAIFPDDAQECKGLLRTADMAMYESKRGGKNQVTRFNGYVPEETAARQKLADQLFSQDIGRQMTLQFQPIYRADDFSLAAFETLTRWNHPEHGLLGPDDFFETAAELGFLRQIDRMAFNRTMVFAKQVTQRGLDPVTFSVNLSFERLADKPFIDAVVARVSPTCPLKIELTESSLMDAMDTRAVWSIDRLREAGIGVHLDGFGCSHASMASLLDLRPESIKLDHRLVSRVEQKDIAVIIQSITEMAHDLGITVNAMGVETISQVERCRELGCDYVQGYALNMPMSREDVLVLLESARLKALA
ncbi:MAG: EAL domain-containing protein [Pseudomonadota bacterium]